MLEEVQQGKVTRIIVAHQDRLIRFGYEWFKRFLKVHGVDVVVVHNDNLFPEGRGEHA
jgi:predicted site-specific integrase-resolvase